jgi:cytochrome c oxidase subunit 3
MNGAGEPVDFQYDEASQQRSAATLGMWVFLGSELMFFGPLFFAYLYWRRAAPDAFALASHHTHLWLGTINTAVLLTSSLTMALAVRGAALDERKATARLLLGTAALGAVFLAIKATEYVLEWREGLVPAWHFVFAGPHANGVAAFYQLYFVMTGFHAVHLTVGIGLTLWMARTWMRRAGRPDTPIEMTGLYWHLVDIIWIFLYPLLYLLERYR